MVKYTTYRYLDRLAANHFLTLREPLSYKIRHTTLVWISILNVASFGFFGPFNLNLLTRLPSIWIQQHC